MRLLVSAQACKFAVISLIAMVFFISSASALDSVTRKSDGKKVGGKITAMSKNDVTLQRTQGDVTVPLSDIDVIDWDGGAGELNIGYSDEKGGRYEKAFDRVQTAKNNAKSASNFLQGEFEYVLARIVARQALIDPEKRDQALQRLTTAQKAYPDHIRYFESVQFLLQLQLSAKDFEGARTTVELLKKAAPNDLSLVVQLIDARVLAAEGKTDDAIASFAAVVQSAGNSPSELACKNEAVLGQVRGLISRSKFEEALNIVEAITEKWGPVENTAFEAESFILQGDALRGLARNKEAILAYLYVDINFPREAEFHAEALYQLIHLGTIERQPDRSAETTARLFQLYPKSEWRKKMAGTE